MVKLEKNGPDATIQAKGHFVEVSSEVIFLVDEFYSRLKRTNEEMAKGFRAGVMEWAKGNFDD